MTTPLDLLRNCTSVAVLRPLLHALCMGFGSVTRLDILTATQVGKRQALCFLRMATPEQETLVMHELGVGRFGGDIVVIVDLSGKGQGKQQDFRPVNREARTFELTPLKNADLHTAASPKVDVYSSVTGNGATPQSVFQV